MGKFQSFLKTTKRIFYENRNIFSIIWKVSPFWVIYSCFVQVYEGLYPIFNNFTTKLLIDSVSDSLEIKEIQDSVFFTLFLIITGTVLLHIILAIKRYIDISHIDRINMSINSKIMNKISEKPFYHFEVPEKMDTIHRVREQGSSKCIQQFSTTARILFVKSKFVCKFIY